MKNKSINQVSIINGVDGPTSVFIFGESQKQSLKIRIRNAIYPVSYTHLLDQLPDTGAEKDFYKVTDSNGKEYLLSLIHI